MDIWKWRPKDTFQHLQLTLSSHELTLVNCQCSGPLPPVARLKRDKKIKSQEHEYKTEINLALTLLGQLTIFSLDHKITKCAFPKPKKSFHSILLGPLSSPLHDIAIAITTWQITKFARACQKQKVRPLHKYREREKIQDKNLLFQN